MEFKNKQDKLVLKQREIIKCRRSSENRQALLFRC